MSDIRTLINSKCFKGVAMPSYTFAKVGPDFVKR